MILPLRNRTIVLTRSEEQAEESAKKLEELGATVILYPTIKIEHKKYQSLLLKSFEKFNEYNYLIFTSVNAVKAFYHAVVENKIVLNLTSIKITAIGKKTAKICEDYGFKVDIIPEEFSAAGINAKLKDIVKPDDKILLPISELASNEISDELEKLGAKVERINSYGIEFPNEKVVKKAKEALYKTNPDLIIFTSPSTFRNFVKLENIRNLKQYFSNILLAAIGIVTKSAIEDEGLNVEIYPDIFTMDSLIEAIANYYDLQKKTESIGRGL